MSSRSRRPTTDFDVVRRLSAGKKRSRPPQREDYRARACATPLGPCFETEGPSVVDVVGGTIIGITGIYVGFKIVDAFVQMLNGNTIAPSNGTIAPRHY